MASKQVGFFCDGCSTTPIEGTRYHCLECPDYDLCEACYNKFCAQSKHYGNNHTFLRVKGTIPLSRPIRTALDNVFTKDSLTRAPYAVSGLVANGLPLTLKRVVCDVRAHDLVAEMRIVLTYAPISATASTIFIIPQETNFLVESMEVECGSALITSHVRERNEVDAFHSLAVTRGEGVYMLQESSSEALGLSIGQLQPDQPVTASVTLLSLLSTQDDSVASLTIPAWITHSLMEPSTSSTSTQPQHRTSPTMNIPSTSTTANTMSSSTLVSGSPLRIRVDWESSRPISEVSSTLTLAQCDYGKDNKTVSIVYESNREFMEPLTIHARYIEPLGAQLTLEHTVGAGVPRLAAHLTVVPTLNLAEGGAPSTSPPRLDSGGGRKGSVGAASSSSSSGSSSGGSSSSSSSSLLSPAREFVILVDQSESMKTDGRMQEALYFAQLLVRAIPTANNGESPTFINVMGFGSDFGSLWQQSRQCDKHTIPLASRYISEMEPDRGGTVLSSVLDYTFNLPPVRLSRPRSSSTSTGVGTGTAGAPVVQRTAFLLTDAEQLDEVEDAVALTRRHRHQWRTFTVGFGHLVSRRVIEGIARAGCGQSALILPGDRGQIGQRARRLMHTALQWKIEDPVLDWGLAAPGLLMSIPQRLPPMYVGSPWHVSCVFDPQVSGLRAGEDAALTVTVRGRILAHVRGNGNNGNGGGGSGGGGGGPSTATSRRSSASSTRSTSTVSGVSMTLSTPSTSAPHVYRNDYYGNTSTSNRCDDADERTGGSGSGTRSPASRSSGQAGTETDAVLGSTAPPTQPLPLSQAARHGGHLSFYARHPYVSTRHNSLDALPHNAPHDELLARPLCKLIDWQRIVDLCEGRNEYDAIHSGALTRDEVEELFREEVIKVAVQSQLPSRYTALASRLHTNHMLLRDRSTGGLYTGIAPSGDSLSESVTLSSSVFGTSMTGSVSGTPLQGSVHNPSIPRSPKAGRAGTGSVLGPLYVYCDDPLVLNRDWVYTQDHDHSVTGGPTGDTSQPIAFASGAGHGGHHGARRKGKLVRYSSQGSEMLSASLRGSGGLNGSLGALTPTGGSMGMHSSHSHTHRRRPRRGTLEDDDEDEDDEDDGDDDGDDDLSLHSPSYAYGHGGEIPFPSSDLATLTNDDIVAGGGTGVKGGAMERLKTNEVL